MNKQKYINKIYKKTISNSEIFKKIIMTNSNSEYKIVLNKILNLELIDDYVAPLLEYNDQGFLIKPVNKFNFQKFSNAVDVLVINSSMKIIYLEEAFFREILDFGFNFYSLIILPNGFIKFINLKIADKIKFKKIKY